MQSENQIMADSAESLLQQVKDELNTILSFWQTAMPDPVNGGFIGAMRHNGQKHFDAPKGAVLNARILWTFSTAALQLNQPDLRRSADSAYKYFAEHFFDHQNGGVYWSVNYLGFPLDTKKQVYAQGFAIYALSAYYKLSGNEVALKQAIELYRLLEKYSYDPIADGYFEAFSENWQPIDDLRLSDKDANEKKTMNTHLHVLEGYTLLYKVWPDAELRLKIIALLNVFKEKIINANTATQGLFFDEHWVRKDALVSYGHDIEASWLLQEAAEAIGDDDWISYTRELSVKMAIGAIKGIDEDGGMWHEYDLASHHLVLEKHWWPQAEALVGFCNAWQNSGEKSFFDQMLRSWNFIRQFMIDRQSGEWKWGVKADYSTMDHEDLAGFWKCPYHNGRACMELMHRLKLLTT
jgi:cellobiose epimerase